MDVSLDGLDGELGPVGAAPHLWAHEGRGRGTWRRGGGDGVQGHGGPEGILEGAARAWGGGRP